MSDPVIRIGHSPDPDDAFMFYGFASGQVEIPGHAIEHVMLDIQSLNEMGLGDDPLEVTALSLHAFLELEDRYEFLEVGTSVGRNYGPRLIANEARSLESLAGCRVALPGPKTTATLVIRQVLPDFEEVHMDFTKIMDAVRAGDVDAGLIIHEGQLTYKDEGFTLLADMGEVFAQRHGGLPLPLGVNCVRSDIDPAVKTQIADAYRKSVNIALTQRKAALDYALSFARGLDPKLADTFVGMYVNEDSLAFNDEIKEAVEILREEYWNHASANR
ncbi:MAG: MqnA/MqnD/SBP family protein [Candidatus Hydrogenedentota bacterium]